MSKLSRLSIIACLEGRASVWIRPVPFAVFGSVAKARLSAFVDSEFVYLF